MKIPELNKNCPICNSEYRFVIQKAVDENREDILMKFEIPMKWMNIHKDENHRTNLIAWGQMDYTIRKKAVDVGLTLSDFIEKWAKNISERAPETIKDNDALNALKLYMQAHGEFITKHEITVKRSIEDVLKEFLEEKEEKVN